MQIIKEIASPAGAVAFDAAKVAMPVEGDATGLTYGRYFDALESFIARDGHAVLQRAGVAPEQVVSLCLRAEKHGALYHPASLTIVGPAEERKLCLNVATTPMAMACLEQEGALLAGLRGQYAAEFLPCPYAAGEVDGLGILLEEWFTGFHEWHQTGAGRVRLWDFDAGERELSRDEALAIYRQAARILTRYFDPETGACIGPWHHAAGDFVARVDAAGVAVRLITVRGHRSSRAFAEAGPMASRLAALSFFTNMSLRLRLDRVDGVGEPVLADTAVAAEAVAGFAQGLGERADIDDGGLGILDFLGSFSVEELAGAGRQLMEPCPPEEEALLEAAWPEHAAALVAALAAV